MDQSPADSARKEHRELDELFGRFLAAVVSGEAPAARRAIEDFDGELRRHTAWEEAQVFEAPAGRKLVPGESESDRERLFRELRTEHVQVRELSAMIARVLSERGDLDGARALAGNLARRWDAHTSREERELFGETR